MNEENQQEEPKSTDEGPFSMRPEDVADYLATIAAENKGPQTPRPNRTELLNHLQAIFNEAREDRRSYRALRAAFSTAVGATAILQSNLFNNIQSASDAVTSNLMLLLLAITGLYTNKVIYNRMAALTKTARLADERIKEVSQSPNDVFHTQEFVTYREISDVAAKQLNQEVDVAESNEARLMALSLAAAVFFSFGNILWQFFSPREGQHVILDNISKEQHVIIDKVPESENGKTSCLVKARVDKKGKITLEIDCGKPEPSR